MKKVIKTLVSLIFGATLLSCVSCAGLSHLGGSIFSSVNEEWNKTEVDIALGQTYISHCASGNTGDYIKGINYYSNTEFLGSGVTISYGLYFNIFDDLETYFVFDNGYTTPVEHSDWLGFGDYIEISEDITTAYNLREAHIIEVWVRTLD